MKNLQGDIVGIADTSGNIVAKYAYDSWGKLISIKDASDVDKTTDTTFIGYINPLRYRGYYYDSETGLYYLNARYYDPEVGRFINADETLDGGYNLFVYCSNNTVNYVDLTGKLPVPISYMICLGSDVSSTGVQYNCWSHAKFPLTGDFTVFDPRGYVPHESMDDLIQQTMKDLAMFGARKLKIMADLDDDNLLIPVMQSLAANEYLIALRLGGADYHYMIYGSGRWTQKYGRQGFLFQLVGITPNDDRAWAAHHGISSTQQAYYETEGNRPKYIGPTVYIKVTI